MVEFFKKIFKFQESYKPTSQTIIHTQSIGSTGTQSYSGYPTEDYLSEMRGTQRADVFDKMRRSDAQVKMCLSAVKAPLKSAHKEIEPYDINDPQSVEDAELVKYVLFEGMEKSFEEFFSEALTFVEFGHSVFEIIDGIKLGHPKFGNINIIKDLCFRSQRTLERWNLDKDSGKLLSISQYAYGDLQKLVDIPSEFLLVFTLDKEGSNYEGISALRACYGNYYRKNVYLKLNAIGIEKFAVPTPLVEVPEGKEALPSYQFLVDSLEKYQSHEANYLTYPGGWKINLSTSPYDPQKVEVSIDNEDKRMVKSFMANFLELGMNGFGSQSLSFDLSDFFLSSLDYLALLIEGPINRSIIPRIVKMNRGERQGYPTLNISGISDRAGKELADTLKTLADGKLIIPDQKLEDHLRERYSIPESSTEGQRQISQPSMVPQLSERIRRLRRGK